MTCSRCSRTATAALDGRDQPASHRQVARPRRRPDAPRRDSRPSRAQCLQARPQGRLDAQTAPAVDPNREPGLMIAVPRCCAPTDDRPDNMDRFGLASPRPVTRIRRARGHTRPPCLCVRALHGPSTAAGAPRGAVDAAAPMDAKTAPTGACKTAKSAVSHSAHNPSSSSSTDLEEHRADLANWCRAFVRFSAC